MTYRYNPEAFEPHDGWCECTIDDAARIAALMGWDINPKDIQFSGFWSQGDGASFTGTLGYKAGCTRAVRAYAPADTELHDIAARWTALQKRTGYRFSASIVRRSHHYAHESTVTIDVDCYAPDSHFDLADDALEIARDFMRWIYRTLEREYEYQRAWNMAYRWQETHTEANDAWRAAIDAMRDYHAGKRAGLPDSALETLRRAITSALEARADAHAEREAIDSEFHYWHDGTSVSIEQFAEVHV